MTSLRYTLVSEGTTDRALLPILTWLLREHLPHVAAQPQWSDLRRLPERPRGLAARIQVSLELFPCDVLFVHRDADRVTRSARVHEIRSAVSTLEQAPVPSVVCVVPVRMLEAWLLFDEPALRRAAGNPNGREPLQMPRIRDLEGLLDPKSLLHQLIRDASGLGARRRQALHVTSYAYRIPEFVEDFSPLRTLSAFRDLEDEVREVARSVTEALNSRSSE